MTLCGPKNRSVYAHRNAGCIGPFTPTSSSWFFCRSVLGDKIAAGILAQTAGVPSIPWSGDGLTAELTSEGTIPDSTFKMPGLEDGGKSWGRGPSPWKRYTVYVFKGRAMSLVGFAEKNSKVVVFLEREAAGTIQSWWWREIRLQLTSWGW